MKKGVRIGELAAACNVSPDTIRFYERRGLLPQPRRTGAGHRIYDESAVDRVMFIRRSHEIGLSLADAQELIRLRERDQPLCRPLSERLQARLQAIERKLTDLNHTRRVLQENIEKCDQSGGESCPVASFLENRGSALTPVRREA